MSPGDPIRLESGGALALFDLESGGRLTSLVIDGRELLVGRPRPGDRSVRWGSFVMAPWVGRMAGAVLDWEGRTYVLPANEGPHALHGLAFDRTWTLTSRSASGANAEIDLGPAGWPFGGQVRQFIRLEPDRLELSAELVAGDMAMPAGLGWHPWFERGERGDASLRVDADEVLETSPDLIPTGRRLPVGGDTDLRHGPILGSRRLDHAFVDVRSPTRLAWPDLELTVEFASPIATVVVYTPPGSVCVEPQTSWPNAAALSGRGIAGTGLVRLEAGETLRARTAWRWARPAQGQFGNEPPKA